MYKKTPSDPDSGTTVLQSAQSYIRQMGTSCFRLIRRYPLYFFAGMLACMLGSGIIAFTIMRVKNPKGILVFPKPPAKETGSAIGGILQSYGALQEITDIQREIQAIIDKDSLVTADSIRLIDALQRFEQLGQPTHQNQNSTP